MASFAIAFRYKLASGATADQDSMMEAITDMPFES
jgi:hypothetical protein